jgi:multicomponent Na+:H+ antiporter subunit G
MSPQELLTVVLVGIGVFFKIISVIGLNRMPDLYLRMHGAAKSTTLGVTFILIGMAVHFGSPAAITRAVLIILFFFLTAPVGVHVLARAAYFRGVPSTDQTLFDQLADQYDRKNHKVG